LQSTVHNSSYEGHPRPHNYIPSLYCASSGAPLLQIRAMRMTDMIGWPSVGSLHLSMRAMPLTRLPTGLKKGAQEGEGRHHLRPKSWATLLTRLPVRRPMRPMRILTTALKYPQGPLLSESLQGRWMGHHNKILIQWRLCPHLRISYTCSGKPQSTTLSMDYNRIPFSSTPLEKSNFTSKGIRIRNCVIMLLVFNYLTHSVWMTTP